jgi:Icc-related predicted phosphoesterase
MNILAVSDTVIDWIYSQKIRLVLSDTDIALGCGDLPLEYLEFIISSLDVPLFYVHGNHSLPESQDAERKPHGSFCLHGKVVEYKGYTFAGVEGSLKYNEGAYQYSQFGMWVNVITLMPSLLKNKRKYGRYLDVFLSHAPPWGVHDQTDLPHQGIKAFRWLIEKFQPEYHFHGHIHVYRPDTITITDIGKTKVINSYGYRQVKL